MRIGTTAGSSRIVLRKVGGEWLDEPIVLEFKDGVATTTKKIGDLVIPLYDALYDADKGSGSANTPAEDFSGWEDEGGATTQEAE